MRDVTQHVLEFRQMMISCWPFLDNLIWSTFWEDGDHPLDDWLQANWELLVQRPLLPEGGAIQTFGFHKRPPIVYLNESRTHTIYAEPKFSGEELNDEEKGRIVAAGTKLIPFMFLNKRVDFGRNIFGCYPPFDYVVCVAEDSKLKYTIDPITIKLENVRFILEELTISSLDSSN